MATVRQTDCKTGWQVIVAGRVYLTVRRESEARTIAAEIDGGAGQDDPEVRSDITLYGAGSV